MINYNLIKLNNELKIFHIKRKGFDSIHIAFYIKVGSAYETKENNGISHLLEHMLFYKTRNKEFYPFGLNIEGTTMEDITYFEANISKKYIEKILPIFKEAIFNPNFENNLLKINKQIVIQEIKERGDDPYISLGEEISDLLFSNTSLSLPVTGTEESVKKIKAQELKNWHKKYYNPENITFTIIGDVSRLEILKLAKKYFGEISDGNKGESKQSPKQDLQTTPQQKNKIRTKTDKKFNTSYIALVFPTKTPSGLSLIENLFEF